MEEPLGQEEDQSNPRCINDAAMHPPVPSALLISPHQRSFFPGASPLERRARRAPAIQVGALF
eukprot:32946-Pyramimonas_sp.AAC.1